MNEVRVNPYARLVEYAWGYNGGDARILKTHVCHIRQEAGHGTLAVRGHPGGDRVGYCLERAKVQTIDVDAA